MSHASSTTGPSTARRMGRRPAAGMPSKSQALARLTRPANARLPLIVFVWAARHAPSRYVIVGAVLIVASYGIAVIVNDLVDVEADRMNGRIGPLVSGLVTRGDARRLLAAYAGLAVVLQRLLPQPGVLAVTIGVTASSFAYSCRPFAMQRRGLWGTALLAASYVGAPLVLARSVVSTTELAGSLHAWTIVGLLLAGCATILYKDFRDEAGDRAVGKRTPVVRYGQRTTQWLAVGLHGCAIAFVAFGRGLGFWVIPALLGGGCYVALAARARVSGRAVTAHRVLLPAMILLAL